MQTATLTRLVDPDGFSQTRCVFRIEPEGMAFLDGTSLRLQVGYTATPLAAPNNTCFFRAHGGAYAMLREVNLRLPSGAVLYSLREAGRFAAFQMMRRSPGALKDRMQYSEAHNASLAIRPDGTITKAFAGGLQQPTASATTTPLFELNLALLLDPLRRGLFPLGKLEGPLTLEIFWQTDTGLIFQVPANLNGTYSIIQPTLTYELVRADEAFAKLPKQVSMLFEEPVLARQSFTGVNGTVTQFSLPLGLAGLRLRRIFVGIRDTAVDDLGSRTLLSETHQWRLNGRNMYPQPIGAAARVAELERAYGQRILPFGMQRTILSAPGQAIMTDGDLFVSDWIGLDLRQLQDPATTDEIEPANSTLVDSAGLTLILEADTQNNNVHEIYGWAGAIRQLTLGQGTAMVV